MILSRRELQTLSLVSEGLTNKAIAQILGVSKKAVDGHVVSLLAKIQPKPRNRVEMVLWALHNRLVGIEGVTSCFLFYPAKNGKVN